MSLRAKLLTGYLIFIAALVGLGAWGAWRLREMGGAARLKRRMVERVITQCEGQERGEADGLLILLRRFALEAAREEARLFCDDLAAA